MSNLVAPLFAFVLGGVLGAFFFGGLFWTVRKGVVAKQPALWFFGSLFLRMAVTLVGFYFIAAGHWERLLLSLLGFTVARRIVMHLTKSPVEPQNDQSNEVFHAP